MSTYRRRGERRGVEDSIGVDNEREELNYS